MMAIRIQGQPLNITIIQMYAPTTDAEEEEVGDFYGNLPDMVNMTPKKDAIFIIGNWNSKAEDKVLDGVTGKYGVGVQNKAGERLIKFCQGNTLVVTNTLFQQPKRRLYTWIPPDGKYRNQIDFILCSQRWRSAIQSVKTRPGADCGSDHELLIVKIHLKLKRVRKTEAPIMIWEYAVDVRNRFESLVIEDRQPKELWAEIREIVQKAAEKHIPKAKKSRKAKWLSDKALEVPKERWDEKSKGSRTRIRVSKY
ncbi:hypothetical protein J437_LFUL000990 [Ladona fulva]|uniref:Endonuclease/exonuclease/phosphatase domain-containing protein n=1 Tax=Ladona fulva TaxID=123851 RepID=A0A8K0KG37_LADFU|nr:hypothetical protein J437_LFUL000990 [Ladona fulva]